MPMTLFRNTKLKHEARRLKIEPADVEWAKQLLRSNSPQEVQRALRDAGHSDACVSAIMDKARSGGG